VARAALLGVMLVAPAGCGGGGTAMRDAAADDAAPADGGVTGDALGGSGEGGLEAGIDGGGALSLFNGVDFTGWQTYLGPPYGSSQPLGVDNDPDGVFSVVTVDGAPAIRVSGEVWGGLTTLQEFADYHLSVQFKWGTHAVWPPLTTRDSGVLYHSVGAFGAVTGGGGALSSPPGSGFFMTSMELQVAQGDVGSYAALGPIPVQGGAFGIAASGQHENPLGAWNTLDIFVVGNESVHVVNGVPVVHLRGAMLDQADGTAVPLVRGKIQLQSESMEIFFRAVTLQPIQRIPPSVIVD
jgi:Domain of Unknown Function (DUF1080)